MADIEIMVYLSRQKKTRISLFCARFYVTLPSEMANLLRLGIKKIKSFVLLPTFRNFAPEYGTETKKKGNC